MFVFWRQWRAQLERGRREGKSQGSLSPGLNPLGTTSGSKARSFGWDLSMVVVKELRLRPAGTVIRVSGGTPPSHSRDSAPRATQPEPASYPVPKTSPSGQSIGRAIGHPKTRKKTLPHHQTTESAHILEWEGRNRTPFIRTKCCDYPEGWGSDLKYQNSISADRPPQRTILVIPEKYNQLSLPCIFEVRGSGKWENHGAGGKGTLERLIYLSEPWGRWQSPRERRSAQAGRLHFHLASFSKNMQTELLWETGLKISRKLPIFGVPSWNPRACTGHQIKCYGEEKYI